MANEHDITVLNTLITTTIDSANGFERSAEDADVPQFVDLFREFAQDRRLVIGRLQERVRMLGGTPNDDGSLKAELHRRWVDLRDAISGGGDKEIIEEVERGEDYIKAKYESALADTELSAETLAVIREGYQSVRAGHDRASALKHSLQGATAGSGPFAVRADPGADGPKGSENDERPARRDALCSTRWNCPPNRSIRLAQ